MVIEIAEKQESKQPSILNAHTSIFGLNRYFVYHLYVDVSAISLLYFFQAFLVVFSSIFC